MHPETHMGTVALAVGDLERSLHFYQNNLGLQLREQSDGAALLGADGRALLALTEQPGALPVQRGRTGLYHYAILVPSRVDLARLLRHMIDTRTPISGASDHGVSEALYLNDPDGHGIEIYRDRPKGEWPRMASGELSMVTDPFDFEGVLAEVTPGRIRWDGIADGTTIGHMHLHVASIRDAEAFYVGVLGFDMLQRYGGQALFVSAGGYHHHIGLNTWAGAGAPPPSKEAARLNWYEIVVPDSEAQRAVLARLDVAGIPYAEEEGVATFEDPSRNRIHLVIE